MRRPTLTRTTRLRPTPRMRKTAQGTLTARSAQRTVAADGDVAVVAEVAGSRARTTKPPRRPSPMVLTVRRPRATSPTPETTPAKKPARTPRAVPTVRPVVVAVVAVARVGRATGPKTEPMDPPSTTRPTPSSTNAPRGRRPIGPTRSRASADRPDWRLSVSVAVTVATPAAAGPRSCPKPSSWPAARR